MKTATVTLPAQFGILAWLAVPATFACQYFQITDASFVFLLGLLCITATITDVVHHKIPNALCYSIFISAALIHLSSAVGVVGCANRIVDTSATSASLGVGVCMLITIPGWLTRMIGGGDVKLSACLGILLGFKLAVSVLLAAHLIAALYVAAKMLLQPVLITALQVGETSFLKERLPMAGFYSCGAVAVLVLPIL